MRLFLVFLFLIGLHTQIGLEILGNWVPNVISFISGSALLLLNLSRVRKDHIFLFLSLIFLVILSMFFAPSPFEFALTRIIALLQFIYTLVSAYGVYLELIGRKKEELFKIFNTILILMITLATVEVFTPLKVVTIYFAENYFSTDASLESIRNYNFSLSYRPFLFTSEPSHVAKTFIVLLICVLLLRITITNFIYTSALSLYLIFLTGSFSMAFILVFMFAIYMLYQSGKSIKIRQNIFITISIILLAFIISPYLFLNAFSVRLDELVLGNDASSNLRLYGSLFVGWEVAQLYPITGAGLGGMDAIEQDVIKILLGLGTPIYFLENWDLLMVNGIGSIFLSFGLIFAVPFLIICYLLFKSISNGDGFINLLFFAIFCFLMGNIYSPRLFIYMFIIGAIFFVNKKNIKLI